ncbi:MAG: hypothetical protein ACREM9_10045 [Gemmatimonadales bacterium]
MRMLRLLVAMLPSLTVPVLSQEPAERPGAERLGLVGMTFDRWEGSAGPALLRPTVRFTEFRGPLGADFAIAFFPDGFSLRPPLITTGLEAGLVDRIAVGPASVLLEGGAAAIVAAGIGGEEYLRVVPGVHYGLGLLVPVEAKALIRADLTRHLYRVEGRTVGIWSVGVGFVVGRRR